MDEYTDVDGIRMHYLDHPGDDPPLILLPGLTANAHSFDGLIAAGLSPRFRVVALDLRGRGGSDAPDGPYDVATHVADIVGVMDSLGLEQAIVGGHSFGGLMTYYLAANHPDRVSKCVVMDAPAEVKIEIMDQIKPSLDRLEVVFPSMEQYMRLIRAMPYFADNWDDAIGEYYRNDVRENPDGTVQAIARPGPIREAALATLEVDWPATVRRITQPTLMLRAPDPLGSPESGPVVTADVAERTLGWIGNSTLVDVPGNHLTFLFGESAKLAVAAIVEFVTA
jgi:pimeloyl-ACP methyl ester carboxylesterase